MHSRIAIGIAVLLVIFLSWNWLFPSRNKHGNPEMEDLAATCKAEDGTTYRLYQGNGGATTAYWYSVTAESGARDNERQILFSYSEPVLAELRCQADGVLVIGAKFEERIATAKLAELKARPIQFWRGERKKSPG